MRRSLKLDQIFHHEIVPAKESNPLSVRKLVCDGLTIFNRREGEIVYEELRGHGVGRGVEADVAERTRHAKSKQAGRPQDSGRLRDRGVRRSEHHRSVVAEHGVERLVVKRQALGVGVDERNARRLRTRVGQLLARHVQTNSARTSLSEGHRPLSHTTAKFKHVPFIHTPEHPELGLRNPPHAPGHRLFSERGAMRGLVRAAR